MVKPLEPEYSKNIFNVLVVLQLYPLLKKKENYEDDAVMMIINDDAYMARAGP